MHNTETLHIVFMIMTDVMHRAMPVNFILTVLLRFQKPTLLFRIKVKRKIFLQAASILPLKE